MYQYVLHLWLSRDWDGIWSRAKSAESYLELTLAMAAVIYPVGARDPVSFHLTQFYWRTPPPPKKKSIEVRSGLLWGQKVGPSLLKQVFGNLSFKALCTDWQKWGAICLQLSISKTYILLLNFKTWIILICFNRFWLIGFYNPGILFQWPCKIEY
jgi:hypothetical protein